MANLTPASAQAIARLRTYVPPPTSWHSLPLTRRAAVLILLFADKTGDLRVVLTMRASTLKTYAGQAALPGGKADSLSETPFQTARREAWEEIGLPMDDSKLPGGFRVEHLCELPCSLARTELGVRPCVALLRSDRTSPPHNTRSQRTPEDILIPRLDPKEVAAVFTAPFHNFLRINDEVTHQSTTAEPSRGGAGAEAAGFPSEWYKGVWTDWHESRWRMHNFYVPVKDRPIARPKRPLPNPIPYGDRAHEAIDQLAGRDRFRVFGMTARILVDASRLAYEEEPEFEHNAHFGDEELIARLLKMGRLSPIRKKGEELTVEILRQAANSKM